MKDESKTTILVVDDVEMNRALMEVMLKDAGNFRFLHAGNGVEALTLLETEPGVDIVLLDLEMPVLNGFETLQRIKSNERTREIPVIVVTSDRSEVLKTLEMRANDFMAKPYNPEELRLRVANHIHSKKLSDLTKGMNEILEAEVARKTQELEKALQQSRLAEYEISLRLGKAAEFRDLGTRRDIRRVSEMARELAVLAGLPLEECEILCHAVPLRDVGTIGVPDGILAKSDALAPSEYEIMKMHTVIGGNILSDADSYPVLKVAHTVALQHHERWDGFGYPAGLAGTGINLYGRIVAIVDAFDALTPDFTSPGGGTADQALERLVAKRGSHFDPDLIDLFVTHLDRFTRIQNQFPEPPGCSPLVRELRDQCNFST